MLFSYQGYVQAALVLGGVDVTGPHLHTVCFRFLFQTFNNDLCTHFVTRYINDNVGLFCRYILMGQLTHCHLQQWVLVLLLRCQYSSLNTKKA